MKKILSRFGGLMFLASILILPGSAKAALHSLGSNVVTPEGTVYTLTKENNQTVRRPYTSAGAFLSYSYNSWETVSGASAEDMALPVGSFIAPQDGKIICSDRGSDKGTCYLITSGKKAGFTSENVFRQFGYNFSYAIYGDVSFLPSSSNIDTPTMPHSAGALINKDGTIYLVANNGLLGLPSWDILKSWGYSPTDIVPANSADRNLPLVGTLVPKVPERIAPTTLDINGAGQSQSNAGEIFITNSSLPSGTVGSPYSADINFTSSSGNCVSATLSGLPAGIVVQASGSNQLTCLLGSKSFKISGTPTLAGNYSVSIYITDNDKLSSTKNLTLVVNSPTTTSQAPDFYVASGEIGPKLANESNAIEVNKPAIIKFVVTNKGGDYLNSLLPSFEWQFPTGVVPASNSGIPENTCANLSKIAQGQSCTFAVKLTYSQTTTVEKYGSVKLVIDPQQYITESDETNNWMVVNFDVKSPQSNATLTITPNSLPDATVGQPYSTQISVSGGTAPYAWETISTTYPSGCCVLGLIGNTGSSVTFNTQSGSTISYSPGAGNFTWTIKVKDANGNSATKTIGLNINSAASLPDFYTYFLSMSPSQMSNSQITAAVAQPITVSFSVTNGGSYSSKPTMEIQFTGPVMPTINDTQIPENTCNAKSSFATGETCTYATRLTYPQSGSYSVNFVIDKNNAVTEQSKANNSILVPFVLN